MTFEQAHQNLLKNLDASYARYRAVHADPQYRNSLAAEAKDSLHFFNECVRELWRLKEAAHLFDEEKEVTR